MQNKQIPIFFTFDNNYVVPAAVAFYSLLNKTKDDIFYKMYVLHSSITSENQILLQSVVNKFSNSQLEFIDTDGFLQNEWNNGNFEGHNTRTQFTSDAILRCFAAKFFPQYDKIIYSDVDVVFVDDISEIYNIDLTDKYFAGVKNAFMKYSKNELSHLKVEHYNMLKDSYIAGGIWVMNLAKIRNDNLESRMLEIINDDSIIKRWNDQDIINIACENKVNFLSLNYISYPYLLDYVNQPNFVSHYSKEELFDSVINPKIIHYAAKKPWNAKTSLQELWWNIYYYLELPKIKIFNKKKINPIKLKLKNIYYCFMLILMQIPLVNLLFSKKQKEKVINSITKYNSEFE